MGVEPKIGVFTPQIIHLFIGFSIIFTIHFGGFTPIFGNIHIFFLRMSLVDRSTHHPRAGPNTEPRYYGTGESFVFRFRLGACGARDKLNGPPNTTKQDRETPPKGIGLVSGNGKSRLVPDLFIVNIVIL